MALLAATVLIHAVGTTQWLRWLLQRNTNSHGQIQPRLRLRTMLVTAVILTALHLVEVFIWACGYLYMVPDGQLSSLEEAFYFSAVTFTTLGYGDITLSSDWRLLSGVQAINGILLIGWSTAFMYAVLHRSWGILIERHTTKVKKK